MAYDDVIAYWVEFLSPISEELRKGVRLCMPGLCRYSELIHSQDWL